MNLDNQLKSTLCKLTGITGYLQLRDEVGRWSRFKDSPRPDGRITFEILTRVVSRKYPEPLREDFEIPDNYQLPNIDFHKDIIQKIVASDCNLTTLVGPPGRGKSTYLSFLCKDLKKKKIPFVRHHYYLTNDHFVDRYSYF